MADNVLEERFDYGDDNGLRMIYGKMSHVTYRWLSQSVCNQDADVWWTHLPTQLLREGKCTECGIKRKLHYHHIKHFADGGLHTKDNLKLLCAACHAEEHKGEKAYHMLKKMAEEK